MANIKIDESQAVSGTRNIAVDEISGEDYQKVKLFDGTAGSTETIQGTAANGLEVDVTRLPALAASSAVIGHVVVDSITGSVTIVPSGTQTVTGTVALGAGAAVIGHVINDASAAVIGHVINDTGSTTAVTALPALPTGTNSIGTVVQVVKTVTTTTAATGTGTIASLSGLTNSGTATFFTSNTWTGTITFQASFDGGTTFSNLNATQNIGAVVASATATANSATGWYVSVVGATDVRIQCTIAGTGSITGTITVTPYGGVVHVEGGAIAINSLPTLGTVTTVGTVTTLTGTTTLTPGTGAANLGKAEDAGHVSGDVGVLALGVRNDLAATDMTSANADNATLSTDIKGRVYTTPVSTRLTMTSAALTIVTTPYTAGDQMGTEMSVANAVRISGGSALIVGATCTSDAPATPASLFELNLYNAATTPAADNAAAAWSDADTQKLCGVLQFPAMQFGTNNGWTQAYLPNPLAINCAVTTLFADFVARGAIAVFTAATDLKVQLTVIML